MPPLRIRGPTGVSTINVQPDDDSYTVLDFQQDVYKATDILPSRQSIKYGYPPQSITTIIPELPFSSLGLKAGDQVIVAGDRVAAATSDIGSPLSGVSSNTNTLPPTPKPTPSSIQKPSTPKQDAVEMEDGFLVHRIVPDDNSCLFTSLALIFQQPSPSHLRKIAASSILSSPDTYNSAILGMEPNQYAQTIQKPSTWGGAIELGVLAEYYGVEIASLDVETGRVDYYTPPEFKQGNKRCLVIYSGIHYDAATLAPMLDAPSEWHQSIFPIKANGPDDPVIAAAMKLGDILRKKKAFTNTSTFDLKCEQCGKGLKGEKEAREHAAATGHVKFGEY